MAENVNSVYSKQSTQNLQQQSILFSIFINHVNTEETFGYLLFQHQFLSVIIKIGTSSIFMYQYFVKQTLFVN